MGTKEILIEARKLIERPENWTQHVFARDENGKAVSMFKDSAKCFCMSGAVGRACNNDTAAWDRALDLLKLKVRRSSIAIYNDDPKRKHSDVIKAFDRAIEAA